MVDNSCMEVVKLLFREKADWRKEWHQLFDRIIKAKQRKLGQMGEPLQVCDVHRSRRGFPPAGQCRCLKVVLIQTTCASTVWLQMKYVWAFSLTLSLPTTFEGVQYFTNKDICGNKIHVVFIWTFIKNLNVDLIYFIITQCILGCKCDVISVFYKNKYIISIFKERGSYTA